MAHSFQGRFVLAGGSALGRAHARTPRNNQDAFALAASNDVLLAVVADGCSGGRASEVGARLATTWVEAHGPAIARGACDATVVANALTAGLLEALGGVVAELAPTANARAVVVGDLFLFTLLVAIATPAGAMVLGLGDGLFAVNGATVVLDAGDANAPPYLAYALLDGMRDRGRPFALRVLAEVPHDALTSIVIATDGACAFDDAAGDADGDAHPPTRLADVTDDPRYDANGSLLQKRLTALAAADRRFQDDVTIALLRRRGPS